MEDFFENLTPPTQSLKAVDSSSELDLSGISQNNEWGRLIPEISNNRMAVTALKQNEYTFGRATDCTVLLNGFLPKLTTTLSKVHFKIIRETVSGSNSDFHKVFILDLSHNGTYVNKRRIPKGIKILLENTAVISLADPKLVAWHYIDSRSPSNEEELPPRLREIYAMGCTLGSGVCGEVKALYSKVGGQMFALKRIEKKNSLAVPIMENQNTLMNEVEILRSLDHPFIVKLEDCEDTPSMLYIVLECMAGGELLDRIRNKIRLSEKITKIFMFQIFSAVRYLHRQKITHRDLKPENILLASTDEITLAKISDFGLSKFVHSETNMLTFCGTMTYVAPEIISGSKQDAPYSSQVDIWSLGVIVYACLSGILPFSTSTSSTVPVLKQILNGRFTFPTSHFTGVSEGSKGLIKSMLTLDPNQRITIEAIMNHDWLKSSDAMSEIRKLIDKYSLNLNNENIKPSVNINWEKSPLHPRKRPRFE